MFARIGKSHMITPAKDVNLRCWQLYNLDKNKTLTFEPNRNNQPKFRGLWPMHTDVFKVPLIQMDNTRWGLWKKLNCVFLPPCCLWMDAAFSPIPKQHNIESRKMTSAKVISDLASCDPGKTRQLLFALLKMSCHVARITLSMSSSSNTKVSMIIFELSNCQNSKYGLIFTKRNQTFERK